MESIRQLITSKKNKGKPNVRKPLQVSSPVEGSFRKLTFESSPVAVYPDQLPSCCQYTNNSHIGCATIDFIPQARGKEETIAWLNTGTYDSLNTLITEQAQAAQEIKRGARTKGTEEVQRILDSPSCRTVEEFHHVRQKSEMAIRWGAPGVVAYNFSKSLGWNRAAASRLPSLQLRGFDRIATSNSPVVPFAPIDWFVLPDPVGAQQSEGRWQSPNFRREDGLEEDRPLSPISEPGGWRDEGEYDPFDIADMPMASSFQAAIAVHITPVCSRQIRRVLV
ncbi:hypothetical protein GGR58DRAFT_193405 [Xylaria digitata]|nr:hypothetical protein GGR58DRAFT_193405 [Xylaria digitata]